MAHHPATSASAASGGNMGFTGASWRTPAMMPLYMVSSFFRLELMNRASNQLLHGPSAVGERAFLHGELRAM